MHQVVLEILQNSAVWKADMRVDNCDFEMNTAVYDDGAIYCDWTSMFIIDRTFSYI